MGSSGDASLQAGDERGAVPVQECFGVEPEAGEEFGPKDSLVVRLQGAVGTIVEHTPLHARE